MVWNGVELRDASASMDHINGDTGDRTLTAHTEGLDIDRSTLKSNLRLSTCVNQTVARDSEIFMTKQAEST